MPRKVPLKPTPEQNKEAYRKKKEHQRAERERRARERAGLPVGPGGPGRPFGTTGGYLKPWMKRILAYVYTDTLLVRDFLLLSPKERIAFLMDLDPKNIGQGTPEEIAARIKAALEAIQNSVPEPE